MKDGFRWCPHCNRPHALAQEICPTTRRPIERAINRVAGTHPLLGSVLDNRYRIGGVIGRGGLGIVFEAEDVVLRRAVAVKLVLDTQRERMRERLMREAKLVASLHHPNICDIYNFGVVDRFGPYIVSERLRGRTIDEVLRSEGRFRVPQAIDVVLQVLSALDTAHSLNIVHRDIKPSNVYLVDRIGCAPHVKVLDFGIAKELSAKNTNQLTAPGLPVGTPDYMSPEQLRAESLTPRADVFSIGIMVFQMLTGEHPFDARSVVERQARILQSEPTSLDIVGPHVPRRLQGVINACLKKDPSARYPDAGTLLRAVLECLPDDDDTEVNHVSRLPRTDSSIG